MKNIFNTLFVVFIGSTEPSLTTLFGRHLSDKRHERNISDKEAAYGKRFRG